MCDRRGGRMSSQEGLGRGLEHKGFVWRFTGIVGGLNQS